MVVSKVSNFFLHPSPTPTDFKLDTQKDCIFLFLISTWQVLWFFLLPLLQESPLTVKDAERKLSSRQTCWMGVDLKKWHFNCWDDILSTISKVFKKCRHRQQSKIRMPVAAFVFIALLWVRAFSLFSFLI